MSERKKEILKSLIDAYIASGEPVASGYLINYSQIPFSSATIRNEMSELESMGYLEQPHTSSGRIPTVKGYKTYVESLMERYRLSMEELELLNELTEYKTGEIENIVQQASRVISDVTNYPTFALFNPPDTEAKRFDAVLIDEHSFLLVMICRNGTVKNRCVKLKGFIDKKTLDAVTKALNGLFVGKPVNDLSLETVLKFEEALGDYSYLANPIMRVVYDLANSSDDEKMHVEGVTKLFSYPEFNDAGNAKDVLELIGEGEKFSKLLSKADPHHANVYIGGGDGSSLPDSGLVLRPLTVDGKTIGAIGVIGPKRMDYKRVIAGLDYFAAGLSEEFKSMSGLPVKASGTKMIKLVENKGESK